MNKTHRIVWSAARQTYIVAHEKAAFGGRPGATLALSLAVLLGLPAHAAPGVNELPSGGSVVAGSAMIGTSGSRMDVLQTSQRTVIDWNTFNIGSAAHVHFEQPSGGVALNRVHDTHASQIYGRLTSTGQVFLVNPNGVLFAPGAQVDVGGLVASTLGIGNADFMAGKTTFQGHSSNAIINQGNIKVVGDGNKGGTAALIAARIENTGSIEAPGGNVLLGAGSKITLDMGGPVKLQIENDALETLIHNGGAIKADGGVVWLTSQAANNLASSVINNTGLIEAQTLTTGEKGEIILFAHDGHIQIGGMLKAEGGFVETSGKTFGIEAGTEIKAGEWLIDPVNITIDDALAGSVNTALIGGNVTITTDGACTGVTCSGTGSDGDITVNSVVSWNTDKTLTLRADRNIHVNANITASHASGKLALEYGQGAVASGNTANYYVAYGKKINLQAGSNFSTKLGSDGVTTNWTVITALGAEGSTTGTDLQGINGALSDNFVLGADINASGTSTWNSGDGWMPLGDANGTFFTGKLDGLGHTISGLTVNRGSTSYVGLFVAIDSPATIRNLHLSGGSITGNSFVGGIAGFARDVTLENVSSTATIQAASSVGGLVGALVGGTIRTSFTGGSVSASATGYAGGLIGEIRAGNPGLIEDSYSSASVSTSAGSSSVANGVGGLVGGGGQVFAPPFTITRSYAVGAITSSGFKGGLVGFCNINCTLNYNNSFWNSETTGVTTTAVKTGVTSGPSRFTTTGSTTTGARTTAQMQSLSNFSSWGGLIVESGSDAYLYPRLTMSGATPRWIITPGATSVTYTFDALTGTYTYNGNPYSLATLWSATALFDGLYNSWVHGTDYVFKHSGGTVTGFTNAGSYTNITVDILKSGFVAASSGNVAGSLTIAQAPLSVTANNITMAYSGSAYAGTPGVTFSGFVGGQDATALGGTLAYAYNPVSPTQAGSYVITPSGYTSSNYQITYHTGTLTISPPAAATSAGTTTHSVPQSTAVATVQNTVIQPVVNTSTSTNIVSPSATPPAIVISQQKALPVMDVSGGLAFVQVPASQGQGGSSSTTNIPSTADLPPDVGGRDPLGFMRVFVIGGGLKLPDVALGAPGQNRQNDVNQ